MLQVGGPGVGKTSLVEMLAALGGNRLRVLPMNSATDTTELLGGFEQVFLIRVTLCSEIFYSCM